MYYLGKIQGAIKLKQVHSDKSVCPPPLLQNITDFVHIIYLLVSFVYQNGEKIFPYTAVIGWRYSVFILRYVLNCYILF